MSIKTFFILLRTTRLFLSLIRLNFVKLDGNFHYLKEFSVASIYNIMRYIIIIYSLAVYFFIALSYIERIIESHGKYSPALNKREFTG